jgi:putative Holliday junction resolvase
VSGVLAIDYGTRKTGFAVADALRIALAPLAAFRQGEALDSLLEHITRLVSERDVDALLVGVPREASGAMGEQAREVLAFVDRLRSRFPGLAVVTWDERLTTKEAESLLREAGHRGRAIAARRDSWAALVLLRDWVSSGEPR